MLERQHKFWLACVRMFGGRTAADTFTPVGYTVNQFKSLFLFSRNHKLTPLRAFVS